MVVTSLRAMGVLVCSHVRIRIEYMLSQHVIFSRFTQSMIRCVPMTACLLATSPRICLASAPQVHSRRCKTHALTQCISILRQAIHPPALTQGPLLDMDPVTRARSDQGIANDAQPGAGGDREDRRQNLLHPRTGPSLATRASGSTDWLICSLDHGQCCSRGVQPLSSSCCFVMTLARGLLRLWRDNGMSAYFAGCLELGSAFGAKPL
jgi:hypothetical protein